MGFLLWTRGIVFRLLRAEFTGEAFSLYREKTEDCVENNPVKLSPEKREINPPFFWIKV